VSVAVALMMKSEVLPEIVLDGDNSSPSVPAGTGGLVLLSLLGHWATSCLHRARSLATLLSLSVIGGVVRSLPALVATVTITTPCVEY